MRVFLQNTHPTLPYGLASALDRADDVLLLPGESFEDHLAGGLYGPLRDGTLSNVEIIELNNYYEQPPDIIICTHPFFLEIFEADVRMMRERCPHIRLVGYSQGFALPFDMSKFDGFVALDFPNYVRAFDAGIPALWYRPSFDFDFWKSDRIDTMTPPSVSMFVNDFLGRYASYGIPDLFEACRAAAIPIALDNYEWAPRETVRDVIERSMATMSLKPTEAFGYSILESLSMGRPVFIYRPFSSHQSYRQWCIEDVSVIYFDSVEDFRLKLSRFVADEAYRRKMAEGARRLAKDAVDNKLQACALRYLLSAVRDKQTLPLTCNREFQSLLGIWRAFSWRMWWDALTRFRDALHPLSNSEIGFQLEARALYESSDGRSFYSDSFVLVGGTFELSILGNSIDLEFEKHISARLAHGPHIICTSSKNRNDQSSELQTGRFVSQSVSVRFELALNHEELSLSQFRLQIRRI